MIDLEHDQCECESPFSPETPNVVALSRASRND